MATVNDFVHQNIKAHLEKCGLDAANANTAAIKGVDFFQGKCATAKTRSKMLAIMPELGRRVWGLNSNM